MKKEELKQLEEIKEKIRGEREQQEEALKYLGQMYGVHAIWFWGIGNIVRLQFSRKHLEFLDISEVVSRILEHFEEEQLRKEGAIDDLVNLPYVNIFTGTLEKPVQKSYVLLSDVIKLLNFRRKENLEYIKDVEKLKKLL